MKVKTAILAAALLMMALPAKAGIILPYDGRGSRHRFSNTNSGMPGIVMVSPIDAASPAVSYQLQRSHAWSVSRRRARTTGAGLVFSSGFAGVPGTSNDRQAVIRAQLSRAHAFRRGYYK